jgi:hypothetical protein
VHKLVDALCHLLFRKSVRNLVPEVGRIGSSKQRSSNGVK